MGLRKPVIDVHCLGVLQQVVQDHVISESNM